jgi:hypothetical protein
VASEAAGTAACSSGAGGWASSRLIWRLQSHARGARARRTRIDPLPCTHPRSLRRSLLHTPRQPLQVHAFKEGHREAHKKTEPPVPAPEKATAPPPARQHPLAVAPLASPLRMRSLFGELQSEVDALSRAFLGDDWPLPSPFARRGAGAGAGSYDDLLAEPHAARLAADVHEEEGAYIIKVDMPGM